VDTLLLGSRVLTTNTVTNLGNLTLGTSLQPISGLTYTYGSVRDLISGHYGPDSSVVRRDQPSLTLLGVDLGRQVLQTHSLAFSYTPPLLGRLLSPRFSWTGGSNQSLQPSLTLEDYDHAVFDINNTDNASLSLTLPLGRAMDKLIGKPGPAGGGAPARPPGNAPADSTRARKPPGDPGARRLFTKVIRLRDIQTSGTLGHRSAFTGLYGTPDWEYRLGFTRDPGVGQVVYVEPNAAYNQNLGRSTSVTGSTQLTLLDQVGVDVSLRKRNDRTETNGRLGRVIDDLTWPDLRFDWGDLQQKVPLVRKVFADFRAVNTAYSRNTHTSGTTENPKEETTVTTTWRPLVSITGTLPGEWHTTLSADLSSSETSSERLGSAGTSSSHSTNSYRASFNKKFAGAGGGSGRQVDLKVDLSYSLSNSETRSTYSDRVQADQRNELRANTSAGLRLTKVLTGTFGLELGQERRPTTDWTRRSIRLYFSTGFNF
jgi:hypothetical protein